MLNSFDDVGLVIIIVNDIDHLIVYPCIDPQAFKIEIHMWIMYLAIEYTHTCSSISSIRSDHDNDGSRSSSRSCSRSSSGSGSDSDNVVMVVMIVSYIILVAISSAQNAIGTG